MNGEAPTAAEATSSAQPHYRVTVRVLTFAAFVVILNETILINAIPRLMDVMEVSARAAQWLTTGFMLTMAVVIPTTGWFIQRVGTRNAFISSMGSFLIGTALAGLAPTFEVLLAGRVIQAGGTAIMMPLLMTTLLNLVPEGERGRVMGNVTLAISVAPALGPTVSGIILEAFSWRWLFGVVLPIGVVIAWWGAGLLRGQNETTRSTLDGLSVALTALGFGSLVYGLSQLGGEAGGLGVPPALMLTLGVLGIAVFAWRQIHLQRHGNPLLDLRVLRHKAYVLGLSIMALAFMGLMGTMILLPLYLQDVRSLSALQTGLVMMPGGLAMGLLGPRVGRVYDARGARVLVIPGTFGLLAGLLTLALVSTFAPWWAVLLLHSAISVSLACVFTPIFTSSLGSLPRELYAHGSALLGTLQQVAAAAGTALVIAVMSLGMAASVRAGNDEVSAMAEGTRWGFGVGAGLAVIVLVLALRLRAKPASPADSTDSEPSEIPAVEAH